MSKTCPPRQDARIAHALWSAAGFGLSFPWVLLHHWRLDLLSRWHFLRPKRGNALFSTGKLDKHGTFRYLKAMVSHIHDFRAERIVVNN